MPDVYIGLGSNIEPAANLRWALSELGRVFGPLTCSGVYASPAYGFDGPDFLNMVAACRVDSDPDAVEAELSLLENRRGRNVGLRSGSRALDLDLLLFGQRVDAARRLPRTDVLVYPFVLAPLAEIVPGLRHPLTGIAVGDLWQPRAFACAELTRLDSLDAA